MSALDLERHELLSGDGLELRLSRLPSPEGPAVLLIHGASAASQTFLVPEGSSLAERLHDDGWDVWLLDWRGSKDLVPGYVDAGVDPHELTFDQAGELDNPAALRRVTELRGDGAPIAVVAHCAGGCTFAQTIARGLAGDIGPVVLTTLGLFYRVSIDGWLKAQDRALEQILAAGEVPTLSPQDTEWPEVLEAVVQNWLRTPLRHDCEVSTCHRASVMFGMPFLPERIGEIHDGGLDDQFGQMPLAMYVHGTQNIRRGWAAPFRSREMASRQDAAAHPSGYLIPEPFANVRLTLITGADNRVWHRDSIDRMYEWLVNHHGRRGFTKHVLDGFGHQDLLWGDHEGEVYGLIRSALRG